MGRVIYPSKPRGSSHLPGAFSLDGFYTQLCEYLARYTDKDVPFDPFNLTGEFSYEPREDTDVSGSSEMAYLLHIVGELEARTNPAGRAHWAQQIRSHFDEPSGLVERDYPASFTREHATGFAVGALTILGAEPYPVVGAREKLESEEAIRRWIDSFLWIFIWWGAHTMGLAAAHFMYPKAEGIPEEARDWVLAELDRRINPRTGLWQKRLQSFRDPDTVALGGSAHFWWQYWAAKKPMPHPERAIDSILRLQMESGLWGNTIYNGNFPQYIDIDAICGLRFAWKTLEQMGEGKLLDKAYAGPILRALRRWAEVATHHLTQPGALARTYGNGAHKLPGGLAAVGEADVLYRELTGRRLFTVPNGRLLRSLFEAPQGESYTTVAWV